MTVPTTLMSHLLFAAELENTVRKFVAAGMIENEFDTTNAMMIRMPTNAPTNGLRILPTQA